MRRFFEALGAITASLAAALTGCSNAGTASGEGGGGAASIGGSAAGAGTGGGSSGMTGSGGVTGSAGVLGSGGGSGGTGGAGGTGGMGASGGALGGSTSTTGGAGESSGATGGSAGTLAGTGGASGGTGGRGGAGSGGANGGGSSGAGGKATTCPPGTPLTGGTRYCSNGKGNAGGGYSYELWADGTGTGCMTVRGVDANFGATWTNVGDFLARVGLEFDRTRTPAQIGTLSADFAETKTGDGGLTYIGIYGWTVNPLREYYILDDWGSTKPAGVTSDGNPRTRVGTLTADGDTYDVWKYTRTNKPAITGDNMTFDQYFSIRQTARSCGHISISQHFSQWIALGLSLGNLVEAKLLVEAQDNSGGIEFTTATVVVR